MDFSPFFLENETLERVIDNNNKEFAFLEQFIFLLYPLIPEEVVASLFSFQPGAVANFHPRLFVEH